MSGKGSAPRPYSVSQDQFAQNFDAIFGKKGEPQPEPEQIEFRCTCGEPLTPDVVHRTDAPCYVLGSKP